MFAAVREVKSCPRCSHKIEVGMPIEVYYKTEKGRRIWAHRGCMAGSPPQSSPNGQADADKADDDQSSPAVQGVDEVKRELTKLHRDAMVDFGERFDTATNKIGEWVRESLDKAKSEVQKIVHVIEKPDGTTVDLGDEVFHETIWRVKKLAEGRMNILIVGPTGCGKTHLCEQLSRLMGMDRFGVISCSSGITEGKVLGRAVPNLSDGTTVYHTSEFVDVYENGGVFLFDEIDALDPNMALVVNAALANKRLPLPDRTDKPFAVKHDDAVIIGAANTWGTGASRSYVGRNQLDEATLDRFRYGTVEMDYDPILENKLCPKKELYDLLTGIRAQIRQARLCRIMSTRFLADAYKMVTACGDTLEDVKAAFFGGWSDDEKAKIGF